MRDISRRIERLEEALGALGCICDSGPEVEILVVEPGWDEARINLAEDAIRGTCPVHGLRNRVVVRFSGSDIYG